jgi:hypothetical protein
MGMRVVMHNKGCCMGRGKWRRGASTSTGISARPIPESAHPPQHTAALTYVWCLFVPLVEGGRGHCQGAAPPITFQLLQGTAELVCMLKVQVRSSSTTSERAAHTAHPPLRKSCAAGDGGGGEGSSVLSGGPAVRNGRPGQGASAAGQQWLKS